MATVLNKPKFRFRINEYTTIGQYVLDAFNNDKAFFAPFTDFKDPFAQNFQLALKDVEGIIFPITLTNQLALVTSRLYENVLSLRPKIDTLENYVISADKKLTILKEDFGIKEVRSLITKKDVEGLDQALKILLLNVADNLLTLKGKGMLATMPTDLEKLRNDIFADNALQKSLLKQRADLVTNNMSLLNDVYDNFINKVIVQAKNIFRNKNKEKLPSYTYTKLIASVRHEGAKTEVKGIVRDENGKALPNVKVVFTPVGGGRTKTVKTNKGGEYSATKLSPDDYTVSYTLGSLSSVQSVSVASAEKKSLDATLK